MSADQNVGNEHRRQMLTRSVQLEDDDSSSHWLLSPIRKKVYMYILTLRRLLNEKLTKGQDTAIEVDKEGFAKLLCHCFT